VSEDIPQIGVRNCGTPNIEEFPYRTVRRGPASEAALAVRDFRHTVELSLHGPWSRDFFGRSKEMFMLMEEMEPLLERLLSSVPEPEEKTGKKHPAP
jgi:hypothetical protein